MFRNDLHHYHLNVVNNVVIWLGDIFEQAQCQATEVAGRLAGLEKVKLMREPEAAALAYGIDKVRSGVSPHGFGYVYVLLALLGLGDPLVFRSTYGKGGGGRKW